MLLKNGKQPGNNTRPEDRMEANVRDTPVSVLVCGWLVMAHFMSPSHESVEISKISQNYLSIFTAV